MTILCLNRYCSLMFQVWQHHVLPDNEMAVMIQADSALYINIVIIGLKTVQLEDNATLLPCCEDPRSAQP